MEKLQYRININAPREKVWNILWDDATYPQWTAAFSKGSRAETDWKKGSKVLFVDGSNSGMVSRVADNVPNEYMSFLHLGEYRNGVEDLDSDAVKKWAGSYENYRLKTMNGGTELSVEMDITEEHKQMFETMWPKALDKLKELAEKQ